MGTQRDVTENKVIVGMDNGLSSVQHQAINLANANLPFKLGLYSLRPLTDANGGFEGNST